MLRPGTIILEIYKSDDLKHLTLICCYQGEIKRQVLFAAKSITFEHVNCIKLQNSIVESLTQEKGIICLKTYKIDNHGQVVPWTTNLKGFYATTGFTRK